MSSPVLCIAVIGTGHIGPRHARAIQDNPSASLYSIVDPNPAASVLAKELNVPYHASTQDMLDSQGRPDGAIVCTPNSSHVAVSTALLNAGIHVLCEKPLATTAEDGRTLTAHAEAKRLILMTGHHRRFNRYMTATKAFLASGRLGRVIAVSGLWCTYKPASYYEPPTAWRQSSASGGGPILINLTHEVDILQFLLGPIIRVHAEATPQQRPHEAEEGAAIILRFASGVVGTFLLSDAVPSPHNFEAGTGENPSMPFVGKDTYRIMGSEGTLSVPDMQFWSYKGTRSWTESIECEDVAVPEMRIPFEQQVAHFVRVMRGEEKPLCSGEDGSSAVAVCEAIKTAMKTEKPVEIKR